MDKARSWKILFALVSLLLISSCAVATQTTQISNGMVIEITTAEFRGSAGRPDIFRLLSEVELRRDRQPYRFAISNAIIPEYTLHTGTLEDGTPILASTTNLGGGNFTYSIIKIHELVSDQVLLSTPENWAAIASQDAIAALSNISDDCERLPRAQAERIYGVIGTLDTSTGIELFVSDGMSLSCSTAWHPRSYGVSIDTSDIKILVTNLSGKIYIQELRL
jgi:hypothetical protein